LKRKKKSSKNVFFKKYFGRWQKLAPKKKLGGVSIYGIHKKTYPKRKIQGTLWAIDGNIYGSKLK